MTGGIRVRRRGREVGVRGLLVDREAETRALGDLLAEAVAGRGGVALIEAPAGKGKSRLLDVTADLARSADIGVLGARASELERVFPFGVAIQLFEPRWVAADDAERRRLSAGPARYAADVFSGALPATGMSGTEHVYAAIHGLYWLTLNLVAAADRDFEPLVLLVDDVQWADPPSLRFLAYLAERIAELPIALVVAVRAGEEPTEPQALSAIRRVRDLLALQPGALSSAGVAALVRTGFPEADGAFCEACTRATGGNPFLLVELIDQLHRDGREPTGQTARHLNEMAPDAVLNAVVARLEAVSGPARRVATAVAILGPAAEPRRVAVLADVSDAEAARAADLLSAMHLFHPGTPLSFVHPLIEAAVRSSLAPLDRAELHRRAAGILADDGMPDEQVAGQLLFTSPGGDPRAVSILRRAAARALASDTPEAAVRLLERALAEGGDPAAEAEVVAELAEAELAARLPSAVERLEVARHAAGDRQVRARLALAHGRALYEQARYEEATALLGEAITELDSPESELADELTGAYIAAAFFVPGGEADARARADAVLARVAGSTSQTALELLARLTVHGGLRGEERSRVEAVARQAWAGGALVRVPSADGASWPLPVAGLLYIGALDTAVEICDTAFAVAQAEDSPTLFAAASFCRAWALYEQGRIVEAAADAQAGLDAQPGGWQRYFRSPYAALACAYIQLGDLTRAETALVGLEHRDMLDAVHLASLLDARAQLRLAQMRPADALTDALEAGDVLQEHFGATSPSAVPWRSTAGQALLGLGRSEEARQLAAEELDQALAIGLPRLISRNLRVLGLAEGGLAGLDLLSEAVQRVEQDQSRLEHIIALLEYGAALRRANRRSSAREPLRRALDLASRGGATALAERAATELAATGARARRAVLSGVPSLTPSERRVADVAAQGLTTRQIAETLFVTPKTVEFHLRHVYRKLEIGSREELAEVLARHEQG